MKVRVDIRDENELKLTHAMWVEKALQKGAICRNPLWTESIAAGDEEFILSTKEKLLGKAVGRKPVASDSGFELKEPSAPYNPFFIAEKEALSFRNNYIWCSSSFHTLC